MVHANDVAIAEGLRGHRAARRPGAGDVRPGTARSTTPSSQWHRDAGHDMPDLNELEAQGMNEPMGYCFPHFFVLPMYSSASSYRFRPLGPGGDADGDLVADPVPRGRGAAAARRRPRCGTTTTRAWPPIPTQDFSNLPRQQRGLHAQGFEYMRLSEQAEGHISNFERTIDGFLAGLPHERAAAGAADGQREPARACRSWTSGSGRT